MVMKQPKWGPGFQDAGSTLYRIEYAGVFLVIFAYTVWRGAQLAGAEALYFWSALVFWAIFPDLATMIPIGFASKQGPWPKWGPPLYNTIHSFLVWGLVFVLSWLVLDSPFWPLLGWVGHIAADRAAGYGLRARAG